MGNGLDPINLCLGGCCWNLGLMAFLSGITLLTGLELNYEFGYVVLVWWGLPSMQKRRGWVLWYCMHNCWYTHGYFAQKPWRVTIITFQSGKIPSGHCNWCLWQHINPQISALNESYRVQVYLNISNLNCQSYSNQFDAGLFYLPTKVLLACTLECPGRHLDIL